MRTFQEKVRDMTDDALEALQQAMMDDHSPWKVRLSAAELILSHAHGSPVSRVAIAQIEHNGTPAKQLDLATLRQQAAALLEHDGSVIDGKLDDGGDFVRHNES